MDALQELAKGVGCAADGAAARNPMAQFINGAMAGPVAGMPGQQMNPAMMAAQRARAAEVQRQMAGGPMMREAFPGAMAMGPRPMAPAQGEAMMREFMARQGGGGPGGLEAAWGAAQAGQQQQMQAAWAAQQMHAQQNAMQMAWAQQQQTAAAVGQMSAAPPMAPQMRMQPGMMGGGMMMPMMPMMGGMMQARPSMAMHPSQWKAAEAKPAVTIEPVEGKEVEGKEKAAVPQEEKTLVRPAVADTAGEVARLLKSNTSDPRFAESSFVDFMSQIDSGDLQLDSQKNTVVPGTAESKAAAALAQPAAMAKAQATNAAAAQMVAANAQMAATPQMAQMEAMWKQALDGNGQLDQAQLAENMAAMWGNAMGGGLDQAWGEVSREKELGYQFQEENEHKEIDDAFERGMRAFNEGRLTLAISLFEVEAQRNDDHSEAWRMLGQCHAENDEDVKAIACLERAVERDPYNLPALLALGVSYVNELDSARAVKNLKAWVQHNPEFAGLEVEYDPYSDGSAMDEAMQLMLKAKAHSKTNHDVEEVLGVLYNVSRNYDNAIAAFKSALDIRPNDYALWNKLGATQANSSRSEEAMPAYHRALELKPRYARGWLNLGIAHANVGTYAEAARCYLSALALNPKAVHIWSYLRIAFSCLDRYDLASKTDARDVAAFADEYDIPFLDGGGGGMGGMGGSGIGAGPGGDLNAAWKGTA